MSGEPVRPVVEQPRVLIADDDIIIRGILRALLTKVGQVVEQVDTTDKALALTRNLRFDLVILDIAMPPNGGLHVCRSLRGQNAYRDVPIVVLTARDTDASRQESANAGATLFVTKPFNPAELMERLTPYLHMVETDRSRLAEILSGDRGLLLQDAASSRRDM